VKGRYRLQGRVAFEGEAEGNYPIPGEFTSEEAADLAAQPWFAGFEFARHMAKGFGKELYVSIYVVRPDGSMYLIRQEAQEV
jgi:hypothetical protein